MNKAEIQDKLGIKEGTFKDADFNPLRLALSEEFDSNEKGDYRDRAIKRCVNAKVGFQSETNTIYNLAKLCIKVINPATGNEMQIKGGGGSGASFTISAEDPETGDRIDISLNSEAINVMFHEK